MQGCYKVFVNDQIVVCKNIITNSGKLALLKAISGERKGWALSILAGIGAATATATDQSLQFLASGADITTTIVDPVNEKVFFKTSLPVFDEYTIYELGCAASQFASLDRSDSGGGGLLVNITTDLPWTDTTGVSASDTTNSRIGKDAISYAISASSTVEGNTAFVNDLAHLKPDAEFKLAYYAQNLADLIVRFKVDSSNYYESAAWSVTNGYNISSVQKSAFTATGSPDWANIEVLEVEATATGSPGTISLDALRYELPFITDSNLLSRVVLPTPQDKLPGLTMDIEYMLELDL